MARYYYDVYKLNYTRHEYNFRNFRNHHNTGSGWGAFYDLSGYNDFGYTSTNGYYGIGSSRLSADGSCYRINSQYSLTLYVVTGEDPNNPELFYVDYFSYALEYDCDVEYEYYRGDYIKTIIAEDGTYPNNGHDYDYWYVKRDRAFPKMETKIGDDIVTIVRGQVKIGGELYDITDIETKIGDQFIKL